MIQTMPLLFWGWFYGILFLSFSIASLFYVKFMHKPISVITIIIALLVPFLHLIQAIPRAHHVTEFQYFWQQLKLIHPLCVLLVACYLYLICWWIYVYIQLISILFFKEARVKKTK